MNPKPDLGHRLRQHFTAEAPNRAPDWVLHGALATIDDTRQRRPFIPVGWRLPRIEGFPKAAVAAASVAVLAVLVWSAIWPGPGPGPGGRPSPSPSPSPTPVSTSVPSAGPTPATSGAFQPGFTFLFPDGQAFDYGAVLATYFEIRVEAWADAGHPGGLIIQNIGGSREDPCDGTSPALPIAAGPIPVIEYLTSVSQLSVSNERATTIAGLPAREATIVAAAETPECPDLWLWVEDTESFSSIPRGLVLRMIAVDVDGEHLVFTIYGEPENAGWKALADQLIASMEFAG